MAAPAWNLVCPACGKRFPVDQPRSSCCRDTPLDLQPPFRDPPLDLPPPSRGIGRYAGLLPLPERFPILDLGERVTPLVDEPWGSGRILFKIEGLLPTGSFKDRGYHVLVNRVAGWGIPEVVGDSSGNAAGSLAAYCARAGIRATLHVPATASPGKLELIGRFGAEIRKAPTRTEARRRALREGKKTFYAGHTENPFFLHGVKTVAYEIFDQLQGQVPRTIVAPVGNGTLILGMMLGFRELHQAGRIDRLPRLVGVQAGACAPLAAAFHNESTVPETIHPRPTLAEGIAIPEPPRGAEILRAVRESGGRIEAVTEDEIRSAHRQMARKGFLLEPTSAAAVAGACRSEEPAVKEGPTVVILTGTGLKTLKNQ